MLKQLEGDNDEVVETWEMHIEVVHYKWQECLDVMRKRKLTFDGMSEGAVAVVDDRESSSVAGEGEGTPDVGSENLDAASSELPLHLS